MTNTLEQEIEAMRQIASALEKLTPDARTRVIRYVLAQIGLDYLAPTDTDTPEEDIDAVNPAVPVDPRKKSDIRSLVGDKRPRSAIEMATLVAFYLAELAAERKETVNVSDLEKYFKQGAYPLPAVVRFALTNAKDAGYLEVTSRGEYRLTPVGHNLVAHEMPTKPSSTDKPSKKRPRAGRKQKRK